MSWNVVLAAVPGQTVHQPLNQGVNASAVEVWNGTPFDLTFSGVGTQGTVVIVAGIAQIFDASAYNSGQINITPVNNNNVGGTGVINVVVYQIGDIIPTNRLFPISIPTQTVNTAGGVPGVANQLINTGNPASSTPIIQVAESGSTGNNLFADNQGNFTDSQYVGAVLTTLFRIIAGVANGLGNDNVLISDANHRTQILGSALIQALMTVNSGINLNGQSGSGGMPGGIGGYGQIGNIPASPGALFAEYVATNFVNNQAIGFEANIESNNAQNATGFDAYCNASTNGVNNIMFNARGRYDIPFAPNNANPFNAASGSVSGTLECWPVVWGSAFKMCWIYFRGLNTASATIASFPSAMSSGIVWPGDIGGSTLAAMYNGLTAQSQRQIIYATTGGTGGSSSAQANIRTASQFTFLTTANGFGVQTTGGAGVNNGTLIVGF